MTLREEFENEIKSTKCGVSVLFETSNQHYIEWLENKLKNQNQTNISNPTCFMPKTVECRFRNSRNECTSIGDCHKSDLL